MRSDDCMRKGVGCFVECRTAVTEEAQCTIYHRRVCTHAAAQFTELVSRNESKGYVSSRSLSLFA